MYKLNNYKCINDSKVDFKSIEDIKNKVVEYREIKGKIKALEESLKATKEVIVEYMGEEDSLHYNGIVLCTHKSCTRVDIDKTKFKTELPELFNKYLKTSEYKRFNCLGGK